MSPLDLIDPAVALTQVASNVTIPNPGTGQAPPGFRGVLTIMGWIKYLSLGAVVIALIIAGAKVAINSRRGDGSESVFQVGAPLIGGIIIAVAFTAVSALAEQALSE